MHQLRTAEGLEEDYKEIKVGFGLSVLGEFFQDVGVEV